VTNKKSQRNRIEKRLKHAFGQVLREYRNDRGMTQETLGFEAGYHSTWISQLERGLKQPSLATVFIIAKHLGVKPDEMIKAVDKKFTSQIRIRLKKKSR